MLARERGFALRLVQATILRGRALVEQKYTWEQQARRLADVFRWVARGGPEPEAVQVAAES